MRKIILITSFTPTADNYRGPSAMMYHLLKDRPELYALRIYSLNTNLVAASMIDASARRLKTTIKILSDGLYNSLHKRYTCAELRIACGIDRYYGLSNYRLSHTVLHEIEAYAPDLVWIYGEDLTTIIKQMEGHRLLIAGYDSFALHYHRLMADPYCYGSQTDFRRALFFYKVAIGRERALRDVSCSYYDVGIADRDMFETVTGRTDAHYYPHPHFDVPAHSHRIADGRLSVVVSGKLDLYTHTHAIRMLHALETDRRPATVCRFTFIGASWAEWVGRLRRAGYETDGRAWVETYADEIAQHDIQLLPIAVGTGTKGKTLDALAAGLLTIGSTTAFENICVRDRHSCLCYEQPEEVPSLLLRAAADRDASQRIAERGRAQVLQWHNPQRIFRIMMADLFEGAHSDCATEYRDVVHTLI